MTRHEAARGVGASATGEPPGTVIPEPYCCPELVTNQVLRPPTDQRSLRHPIRTQTAVASVRRSTFAVRSHELSRLLQIEVEPAVSGPLLTL